MGLRMINSQVLVPRGRAALAAVGLRGAAASGWRVVARAMGRLRGRGGAGGCCGLGFVAVVVAGAALPGACGPENDFARQTHGQIGPKGT